MQPASKQKQVADLGWKGGVITCICVGGGGRPRTRCIGGAKRPSQRPTPLSRTDGRFSGAAAACALLGRKGRSYLVDPASSHMLVSKIKPCMCKYKLFCTVKLRMAH